MAKPNKQHDARAASFKRIAKNLRLQARTLEKRAGVEKKAGASLTCDFLNWRALALRDIASAHEAEAKLLRSMR